MHYDGALKGKQGKGLFLKIKKKSFIWNPPKLTMVSFKWRIYLYTNQNFRRGKFEW